MLISYLIHSFNLDISEEPLNKGYLLFNLSNILYIGLISLMYNRTSTFFNVTNF